VRQMQEIRQVLFRLRSTDGAAAPPQSDCQKIERRQLRRKGFGAGDADLRPGVGI
jgi:hypothetical protein